MLIKLDIISLATQLPWLILNSYNKPADVHVLLLSCSMALLYSEQYITCSQYIVASCPRPWYRLPLQLIPVTRGNNPRHAYIVINRSGATESVPCAELGVITQVCIQWNCSINDHQIRTVLQPGHSLLHRKMYNQPQDFIQDFQGGDGVANATIAKLVG